jgi:hypothetical protein
LIDLADDVVAHHKWRAVARSLWVEVTSYQYVGVLQTGRKHAHPYLTAAGFGHNRVDDFQAVGIAEAADLNDPIVWLCYGFGRSRYGWLSTGGRGVVIRRNE